jgi:hypothetical protein
VIVAHEASFLEQIETLCPYDLCKVRLIDLSNAGLQYPWNSNQLAETRQYFVVLPEDVETPYVSFSSYRLPEKSGGNLGHHDFCRLIKYSSENDVYSPYLIKNSLPRMLKPGADAPAYTNDVVPLLNDLLELCPNEFKELRESAGAGHFLMCNSFCCSAATYTEFHNFITRTITNFWELNKFEFEWKGLWSTYFSGREVGMIFERATAMWFASQPILRIRGTRWAEPFPKKIFNFHPKFFGWRKLRGDDFDSTS